MDKPSKHRSEDGQPPARRLFGLALVNWVDPCPTPPNSHDKRKARRWEPGIDANLLTDLIPEKMTTFFAKQEFSLDTCRRYKEFIRKQINHALKSGIHFPKIPTLPTLPTVPPLF